MLPLKLFLPRDLYERLGERFFNSIIGQLIGICLLHLFFDDFLEIFSPFHRSTQDSMESSIAKNEQILSPLNAIYYKAIGKQRDIRLVFEKPSDYTFRFNELPRGRIIGF